MATTAVRERPILFSGPMVRAILDGRKTQTRRIVKAATPNWKLTGWANHGPMRVGFQYPNGVGGFHKCPYGGPGDRLWVRESWCIIGDAALDYPSVMYLEPRETRNLRQWESGFRLEDNRTNGLIWREDVKQAFGKGNGWRPSIHMPRWASRLTLEITGVRVERVQDISESDAEAEGVDAIPQAPASLSHRTSFAGLWDRINGKGAWQRNDWVWVLTFRQADPEANE